MKFSAIIAFVAVAASAQAADVSSFDFKTKVFPLPPLKLGDGLSNKAPALAFNSPTFQTPADGFRPMFGSKLDPKMRILKPRSDIDFKMIVKEPDPELDPKFIYPVPSPANLGGGK